MKAYTLAAAAFTVAVSGAVCAAAADKTATPKMTDINKTVVVAPGQDTITLRLASNRTTGYAWYLAGVDNHLIEPVSNSYEHPTGKGLVGEPGVSVWTFKVDTGDIKVPTYTTIKMIYARPWEVKASDAKDINVVIMGGDN